MTGIEIIVLCAFAVWAGRVWWDRRRGKKRTALNVATLLLLFPASAWTLFAPSAILHFHAEIKETLTRAAEMANIVAADGCNLFRDSDAPAGKAQYTAFAGRFFGPAISGKIELPLASGEQSAAVFSAFTTRRFWEDNFTGETAMAANDISVYADGIKVAATQTIFISAGYEGADAVAVIEKIADSRQARIVLSQNGETAEAELSEGDICRFRKLRDLWREGTAAAS